MTATSTERAEAHAETLARWEADRKAIDDELAELVEEEEALRIEWQKGDPSRRSDGATSPVTQIRKRIETLAGKRERLAADIQAKRVLLEGLEDDARAEQSEAERLVAEQARHRAEKELEAAWAAWVATTEKLRELWTHKLCPALQAVDGIPGAGLPMEVAPADFARAVGLALSEPGEQPYAAFPRVVARRIPVVATAGTTALQQSDSRGAKRTLAEMGNW